MQARSTVLLLFIDNELERTTTWHNPTGSRNFLLREERIFADVFPSVSAKQWPEIATFAWNVSPRLAIQLVRDLAA